MNERRFGETCAFCYAEDVLRSVVRDVLRINAQGMDAIVDVLI